MRSRSSDEACDPVARLLDLLEAGRITGAHVPSSPLPERVAGNGDDLLFDEEALRELVVAHARRGDVREAVERATRLEALEAHLIKPAPHHLSAAVVLADHPSDLVLARPQRLERRVLPGGGHAHHRVLVDLHHLLDDLGRRAGIADPPARHRVRLREAREVDGALTHSLQRDDRAVLAAGHQDVAVGVVRDAAKPRGVLADRLAQRLDAVIRRVLGPALFDRADRGLAEALGSDEVRFADPERDHALDPRHKVEEAADTAGRYALDLPVGQRTSGGLHAAFTSGRARWCGVARSYAAATRNIVRSWYELAMTWRPTGNPSESPHGREMPGRPEMFTGRVKMSFRYIASGSFTFAPIANATVGDVGVTSASTSSKTRSYSALISVRTFCAFT